MNTIVRVLIEGDFACFSEVKTNRKSYPIITPSAARNIIQAICWKPAIRWEIHRVLLLNPIQYMTVKRNEVKGVIPLSKPSPVNVSDPSRRTQTVATILQNVAYVVEVEAVLTPKGLADGEQPQKFVAMLERRLKKGQHYSTPYLGLREFTANVSLANGQKPIDETRDLGEMFYDRFYPEDAKWKDDPQDKKWSDSKPFFFDARLVKGILTVPTREKLMGEYA